MMKTSTRLRSIAIEYMRRISKRQMIEIKLYRGNIISRSLNGIPLYCVRQLTIYGNNKRLFQFASKCQHLQRIVFRNLLSTKRKDLEENFYDCIKEMLKNIHSVEFIVHQFCGECIDRILENCTNMKSLIIAANSDRSTSYENTWFHMSFPSLKTIQWDDGFVKKHNESEPRLTILMKSNPSITNLQVSRNFLTSIQFIKENKLILNNLCLIFKKSKDNIKEIAVKLNELYENGHFQKLELRFEDETILINAIDDPNLLKALESISVNGLYFDCIKKLKNLKMLSVNNISGGDANAKQFSSLKKLCIKEGYLSDIEPFVSHCALLTEIVIDYVYRDTYAPLIDIKNLNKRRLTLVNAKLVTLYVEERVYNDTYQKVEMVKKLIEIRRANSYQELH